MNEQWSKYKIHRDIINYLIRAVERQYYQDQLIKQLVKIPIVWGAIDLELQSQIWLKSQIFRFYPTGNA